MMQLPVVLCNLNVEPNVLDALKIIGSLPTLNNMLVVSWCQQAAQID